MISVCMATFNGEKYLKKQIESILIQLKPEDELIISDDGSTDKTMDIIFSFKDSRIKVLNHCKDSYLSTLKKGKSFYYATKNFENALKESKGDYIFLSDQDDIWEKNKIVRTLEYLGKYDLVISNYGIIDGDDNIINKKYLRKCPINKKSLLINVIKSKFLGCTMAMTRNALARALPFPKQLFAHDLWIGCLNFRNTVFIDDVLHLYRRHGENVSQASEKSKNNIIFKISYRIKILQLILNRRIKLYFNQV